MEDLTKQDIKDGLFALGLKRGMTVMAHASLAGFGEVEGGADAVIDAILEVLGDEGTLAMPSFSSPDEVFDYRKSPCGLGKIPEVFWRREGVARSLHPTHSVSARGLLSGYLLDGHEKAATAYGEHTPYKRLIDKGAYVLMLGVDLDRLTLLHTVEAFSDAPYLKTVKKKYVDSKGNVKELVVEKMAGPHRNFIGLDPDFRENGIMRTGKIGNAVCRLINAPKMFEYCLERMRAKPDLMLCENPSCGDCASQRGKVREQQLSEEDFVLSAQIEDRCSGSVPTALLCEGIKSAVVSGGEASALKKLSGRLDREGIKVSAVYLPSENLLSRQPTDKFIQYAAGKAEALNTNKIILSLPAYSEDKIKPLLEAFRQVLVFARDNNLFFLLENGCGEKAGLSAVVEIIERLQDRRLRLAYNPANFSFEGGKPFLDSVRKIKYAGALYVNDGLKNLPGEYRLPGQGNSEIKEIISALRARSFDGILILEEGTRAAGSFKEHAGALRNLLAEM